MNDLKCAACQRPLSGTGLEALRLELAQEKSAHEATFDFFTEEVRRRMESHGQSLEELVQARNETLDIREAARAVLGVLRDRLDGTADEHLVGRLQAAVEGGVR